MFDRLKNFVLSTFVKNLPLIQKTSEGAYYLGGGGLFYSGEGVNIKPKKELLCSLWVWSELVQELFFSYMVWTCTRTFIFL